MRTPTKGTVKWLENHPWGEWVIEITTEKGVTTRYHVFQEPDHFRLESYDFKTDKMKCYYVKPGTVWTCDCKDAQYNGPANCKHARALRAAMKALPF